MKYIILLIVSTLLYNSALSQDFMFNKTYDEFYYSDLRSVVNYKDGYVVLGGGYLTDNIFGSLKIIYIYIDNNGEVVWKKSLGEQYANYFHGERNSLKKNQNGGYSLAGSRNDSINHGCLFIKFNEDFDTLWTKVYSRDTTFVVLYNHIETSNGDFLLIGGTKEQNTRNDVLVIKTDSLGNIIWRKCYNFSSGADTGYSITENPYNGYIIGGGSNGDNFVFIIDENGEVIWRDRYGHRTLRDGGINTIISTQDSGFIAVASETLYEQAYNYAQGCLRKYNKDLEVEWYRLYSEVGMQTALSSVIELPDRNLAVIKAEGYPARSYLLFLNSQGDSLRQVRYNSDGFSQEHFLESLIQTPDNGFIMAGTAYGNTQQVWVVKTDVDGCDSEDCNRSWVSVGNIYNNNISVNIFPNPAYNELNIEYNISGNNNSLYAELFDMHGTKILAHKIRGNYGIENINISNLKSGIYLLRIGNYNKVISVIK